MSVYPKILILLEPFNDTTGMGVTLTNLFKDWPKDKISIAAYNLDIELCEKIRPCQSYYAFSLPTNANKLNVGERVTSRRRFNGLRKVAKFFLDKLGVNDFREIQITDQLKKSIKDFQPEIIFSALGDLKRIRFTERVLDVCPESKLAVYIVDDWPNTRQNGRWFSGMWGRIYDKSLRRLLDKTTYYLSICHKMSESYLDQYGKRFLPFHNPVDNKIWNSIDSIRHYPENVFSIAYVGKINRDTKENILTLASVIDSLNKRGIEVKFDVYTPSKHDIDPMMFDGFSIVPPVSNKEIPVVLKGYDSLYLTLGFSKVSRAYARLSMPTKLTEYLASGVPVLLHAPEEIAVTEYVSQTKTGLVCTTNSRQKLERDLLQLIYNPILRDTLRRNALKLAKAHDVKLVRNEFREALSERI